MGLWEHPVTVVLSNCPELRKAVLDRSEGHCSFNMAPVRPHFDLTVSTESREQRQIGDIMALSRTYVTLSRTHTDYRCSTCEICVCSGVIRGNLPVSQSSKRIIRRVHYRQY